MKQVKRWLPALGLGVLSGIAGYWAARYGRELVHTAEWSRGQLLAVLALLPLAWLLAVAMHELGHVLAGRLQGFRLHWLTVGPLMWRRQPNGQLRFEWNRNLNTAGGLALCVPPDDVRLRERYRLFAAGGPAASLLWGALALGGYALLPAATQGTVLAASVALSGGISLLLCVLTLVPLQAGGFVSDGRRILNLSRPGPTQALEVCMLSATIRAMAGTRPRDLNRAALQAAAALGIKHPFKAYADYYLYLNYLDAGEPATAGRHLAEYRQQLSQLPPPLQASGWLESAFFSAAYEHDASAAGTYLATATVSAHTPTDLLPRAKAAVARLAGDAEKARAQAQLALRELPRNLDQGSAHFHREWLLDTVHWAENQAVPV